MSGPDLVETANRPPVVQMLIQLTREHLRVDIDICRSNNRARELLLERLAGFETPTLQRRDDLKIGHLAFVEPEGGSLLFLRSNVIGLVRNAGPAAADPLYFGARLDALFSALLLKNEP